MAKLCNNCGKELTDDAFFCSNCGADQQVINAVPASAAAPGEPEIIAAETGATEQSVPEEPSQELPPVGVPSAEAPHTKQKKSKKWLWWAIPVAVVLVLAIAAALLWRPLMLKFSPRAYLALASEKTISALMERTEGSPVSLLGTAQEILKKGTADISVGTNDPEIGEISIDLSMASDQAAKKYAISGEMQFLGQDIDMDLYMDGDVFTLKVNPFTNGKYYGVTYDSFDADIRASAFSTMLNENTITQISDIVKQVDNSFDNSTNYEELLEPYIKKIIEFIEETELTTGSELIELNGKQTKCDTVTATLEKDDLVSLLEDLVDMLEADEKLRESMGTGLSMAVIVGEESDPYAEMINELRNELNEFKATVDLKCELTYYIHSTTLVAVGYELQMSGDDESDDLDVEMLISFGADAAKDDIIIKINVTSGETKNSAKVISSLEKDGNSYKETVSISAKSNDTKSTLKLIYDWNRKKGELSVELDMDEDGEKTECDFTMVLKETEDGFEIGFDDLYRIMQSSDDTAVDSESADLSVSITYSKGCEISAPEFVNLDQIDMTVLGEVLGNLSFGGKGEEDENPDDDWSDDNWIEPPGAYYKDTYSVSDQTALENINTVIATIGDRELTNGDLQIHYWMGVYDFLNEYGEYAEYFGLDYKKPLDEQEYDEDGGTWQHYFLETAIQNWNYYAALAMKAESEGLKLDTQTQEMLDGLYDTMAAEAATAGFDSVEAMMQADMGPGCTFDNYHSYMKTYYYGYAYYTSCINGIEITDDMLETYYTENQSYFDSVGVTKDSGNVFNVRHILIEVEGSDDAAWAACENAAQALLKQWLNGGGTEDAFAEMANQYSADPGSNTAGGMYEFLDEETTFVPEFVNWYMEEGRQIGDYGLIKTDYGYHLMYCSDITAEWIAWARSDLMDEASSGIISDAIEEYPMTVDYEKIVLGVVDLSDK